MVKSTESRKFARTTNHLSRIQGIAPNREIPTELLDDHRALEPPDPIPNSVVKRRIADGSVVLHHVRVGHRQAPIRNPRSRKRSGVSSLQRGKLRGRSRSCKRVGGAARTDKDAVTKVRMAHPAVDPLTLREQSSLLQLRSALCAPPMVRSHRCVWDCGALSASIKRPP